MSTYGKKSWGAYEMTRAAYDEQRAAEVNFSVWFEVKLHTTYQRGVYKLTITSQPLLVQDYHLKHSISIEWPNSSAQSFEALLYQQMHKMCRMLESAHLDVQRQQAKLDKWA
jgi:hypothetical protein